MEIQLAAHICQFGKHLLESFLFFPESLGNVNICLYAKNNEDRQGGLTFVSFCNLISLKTITRIKVIQTELTLYIFVIPAEVIQSHTCMHLS